MLDQIRDNDIIVVWKLDRLARSTRDLLETMEIIRQAGGKFQSLSETLGRYHHPRGQADYDHFRWDRRVRARSNPIPAFMDNSLKSSHGLPGRTGSGFRAPAPRLLFPFRCVSGKY
jgi:Resolvase, N terminal domain